MKGRPVVSGLCGLLLLTSSASADSLLAPTEKAYRLLQTVSSQLRKAQESLGPSSSAPAAAALAAAQEQVRTAFVHCCRALYTAQLQAAKAPVVRAAQRTPVVTRVKEGRFMGFLLEWKNTIFRPG